MLIVLLMLPVSQIDSETQNASYAENDRSMFAEELAPAMQF
jgi:hypothetical protein